MCILWTSCLVSFETVHIRVLLVIITQPSFSGEREKLLILFKNFTEYIFGDVSNTTASVVINFKKVLRECDDDIARRVEIDCPCDRIDFSNTLPCQGSQRTKPAGLLAHLNLLFSLSFSLRSSRHLFVPPNNNAESALIKNKRTTIIRPTDRSSFFVPSSFIHSLIPRQRRCISRYGQNTQSLRWMVWDSSFHCCCLHGTAVHIIAMVQVGIYRKNITVFRLFLWFTVAEIICFALMDNFLHKYRYKFQCTLLYILRQVQVFTDARC